MTGIDFRKVLTVSKPEKSLTSGFKRGVGRNNRGRITTRHKGGGHKRLYRNVDFLFDKYDIPFVVKTVEYDPNRSGFIGLIVYKDGEKRYALLHKSAKVGDTYIVSEKAPLVPGNRLPLGNITVGTFVYNIEVKHKGGAKLGRSGGNYAEVLAKEGGYVHLKLPSGEIRKFLNNVPAYFGIYENRKNIVISPA